MLALRLLDHIRARIVAFQEETGHMYNLEATPAEGTTYRFAKEDRKPFGEAVERAVGLGRDAARHQREIEDVSDARHRAVGHR